jgi:hypothetical protein
MSIFGADANNKIQQHEINILCVGTQGSLCRQQIYSAMLMKGIQITVKCNTPV